MTTKVVSVPPIRAHTQVHLSTQNTHTHKGTLSHLHTGGRSHEDGGSLEPCVEHLTQQQCLRSQERAELCQYLKKLAVTSDLRGCPSLQMVTTWLLYKPLKP